MLEKYSLECRDSQTQGFDSAACQEVADTHVPHIALELTHDESFPDQSTNDPPLRCAFRKLVLYELMYVGGAAQLGPMNTTMGRGFQPRGVIGRSWLARIPRLRAPDASCQSSLPSRRAPLSVKGVRRRECARNHGRQGDRDFGGRGAC